MLSWLAKIVPSASYLDDTFRRVSDFGASNPYLINVQTKVNYKYEGHPIKLFGADVNRFEGNQGNPNSVLTTYGYNTFTENAFLANTQQAPFQIGIIRIETANPQQFLSDNSVLNFSLNTPTGEGDTLAVPMYRRLNQYQQNAVEMDVSDLNIVINGDMLLEFNIFKPSQTLIFYFYPTARASYKLLFQNGKMAQKYVLPNPALPLSSDITPTIVPYDVHM
jgi:hypothetical protein